MIRPNVFYRPLLAGLIAGLVAMPAIAQQAAGTGLGQSWPNAKNLSAAPGWRVYVFVQDGVKYIQVNDLTGTVRATVATANGHFLVLPLGTDAQRVSTSDKPLAMSRSSTAPAVTIYKDGTVLMTATYQSNGYTSFAATPTQGACGQCGTPQQ